MSFSSPPSPPSTNSGVHTPLSAPLAAALSNIESQFHLSTPKLRQIVDHFHVLFRDGLQRYGADMAMVPTFVTGVPNGSERGTFLALDLGGTNLRVCEVRLLGNREFTMKQEKYKVSEALKGGPVQNLFNYIADSVDTFLTDFGTTVGSGEPLLMGFTFSFPVDQTAIDRGKLIHWTKGFHCPDAPGKDVVQLLQAALDRKHIKVRVNALVNDTVGTLLTRGYQTGGALVGAIFGTGTNGAYVENLERIEKLGDAIKDLERQQARLGASDNMPDHMIVNTEWGAYDNERKVLPITLFDNHVDRKSINPRQQTFEKMISGMYLGEVTRVCLLHLVDLSLLFSGYSSTLLNTQYGFDTAYMSSIEADDSPDLLATRRVLVGTLKLPREHVSDQDCRVVKRVCRAIGMRAARLSACAIAAVILHTGKVQGKGQRSDSKVKGEADEEDAIYIGVDGSVAEFYPGFQDRMRKGLAELLGEEGEKRIKMGLAKDGSGVGAALTALQAKKQEASGHKVVVNRT